MKPFKIIYCYLAKYIALMTFFCLLVIASLDILFNFLAVQNNVGVGNFYLYDALIYAILCSPVHLVQIFPIILLLGIILGLGILTYRKELIMLQLNGISIIKIFLVIIIIAIGFTSINLIIAEYIAPRAKQIAELNRTVAKSGNWNALNKEGLWLKIGNNFIHINAILMDGTIKGVTRYSIVNNKITQIQKGDYLYFKNNAWYADKTQTKTINPDSVITTHKDNQIWEQFLKPDFLEVVSIAPEYLGIRHLLKFIKFKKSNHLNYERLNLALYQKIAQPFNVFIMVILALPFIFSKQRSLNISLQAFLAIILGITYFLISKTFLVMVKAYKIPIIVGILGPGIIFTTLAVILLLKKRV